VKSEESLKPTALRRTLAAIAAPFRKTETRHAGSHVSHTGFALTNTLAHRMGFV
jgi:hypothetical protein